VQSSGPVVIVIPQVTPEAIKGFVQVPVFGQPTSSFLFLQAAMNVLDITIPFRVMVGRAPMGGPQSR
jgi:hypothetical protein